MRYTDKELGIIKSLFADNNDALIALRKKILGFEMSKSEKAMTKYNADSLAVLLKTFTPQIEGDAPIHQVIDLWMTVDIKDKTPQEANTVLTARNRVLKYLKEKLKGDSEQSIYDFNFSENNTAEENFINMTARNTIVGHTESQLKQLEVLAGQKDETIEELQTRLQKDSTK